MGKGSFAVMKKMYIFTTAVLLFAAATAIIITNTGSGAAAAVSSTAQKEFTLVIDAGHGGLDGGAVGDSGVIESDINLAIAQRLRFIANFLGLNTIMTRESENIDYPDNVDSIKAKKTWDQKRRAAIIEAADNAVLISIHQNKYPDKRPCGAQVLYAASEGSQMLGELVHGMLLKELDPENRRVASPISDSIFLLRNIKCPGILIECGFISNPDEARLLKSECYEIKLAIVIAAAYARYVSTVV